MKEKFSSEEKWVIDLIKANRLESPLGMIGMFDRNRMAFDEHNQWMKFIENQEPPDACHSQRLRD